MVIFKVDTETACGAPSLATGEEVSIADSKLATKIQPTDIQVNLLSLHILLSYFNIPVLILIYLLRTIFLQPLIDVCSTSGTNSGTDEIPFKPSPLTNKERLVLRKQALMMRKRPVLSVGTHT